MTTIHREQPVARQRHERGIVVIVLLEMSIENRLADLERLEVNTVTSMLPQSGSG